MCGVDFITGSVNYILKSSIDNCLVVFDANRSSIDVMRGGDAPVITYIRAEGVEELLSILRAEKRNFIL